MSKEYKLLKYTEPLLILVLWIAIMAVPLLVFQSNGTFLWSKIVGAWLNVLPFFILFIINHYFLIPLFLFRHKKTTFFIAAIILTLGVSFSLYYFDPIRSLENNHHENMQLPPHPQRLDQANMPKMMPPPPNHNQQPSPFPYPPYVNSFIICILVIGFSTGLRMVLRWSKLEKERTLLEKENVQNQLAFLRNQVSPHFLMNTLNNIHVLIDIDTEEAKDAVIKLSKLMRHLLYDSEATLVSMDKEFDFITSYINLMKLRVSDKVNISLNIPTELPSKKIPPLLFTSFVENAFKHGISYQKPSYIDINFSVIDGFLTFEIRNSIHNTEKDDSPSGIGIPNSVKRLNILYGDSYTLNTEDNKTDYKLELTIPI